MDTVKVLSFLTRLRKEYLQNEDDSLLCSNKSIVLSGHPYKLNVWQDFRGTQKLVIFQIKPDSIIATDSVSIGLRYPGDDAELIDQQQLETLALI